MYAMQLEILLLVLALGVLLWQAISPFVEVRRLGLALAGLVALIAVYSATLDPMDAAVYHGMYRLDAYALFCKRLFLVITVFVLVLAAESSRQLERGTAPEQYFILLVAAAGMLALGSVNDLILLFVTLELVTVAFYVLTSYLRSQPLSLEAGTKYLIMGALSGSLTVYGISFVFGTTGTTNLDQIAAALRDSGTPGNAFLFGMLLLLTGLSFKIASFPGQMWAPDVYQGAPTPVTAFLACGSKAAGFALLLRLLLTSFQPVYYTWTPVLLVLAAVSLLYGNLGALHQPNLKRLMGYSSIAHAGYLLMGLAALSSLGAGAVLFYLVQYAFAILCGFAAIVAVSSQTGSEAIASFSGLHRRAPLLAAALGLAMFSLAGIPPLSGFFGKFLLFAAVLQEARGSGPYLWLAILAAAGVLVSFYYYLGVARALYVEQAADPGPIPVSLPIRLTIYICMAALVLLGVFQAPLLGAASRAVAVFALR
jgi:NADH-quinone oxidoreductase subunit N